MFNSFPLRRALFAGPQVRSLNRRATLLKGSAPLLAPSRSYIPYFDRLVSDKMRFFHVSGSIFFLLGFANLASYGFKMLMGPERYNDLTGYEVNSRKIFAGIKSQIAANGVLDLVFTAPVIGGLGYIVTQKMGGLFVLKFAMLSFFFGWMGRSIYVSYDKKATCRGAVPLASALVYFALFIHSAPAAIAAWAVISFFYGVQESGGLAAAYIAYAALL